MSLPEELSCAEVKALVDAGAVRLLDVRTSEELDLATLQGATHVPLHELEERAVELGEDKTQPIVVLCHHGVRSLYGAEYLRTLGFDATSMRGGIDAWALDIDATVPRY